MKKVCYRCKRELNVTNFYRKKENKDGLNGTCKDCINQERRKSNTRQIARELRRKEQIEGTRVKKLMKEHKCYKCIWGA